MNIVNTNVTTHSKKSDIGPVKLIKDILDHSNAVVSQAKWSIQNYQEHPGFEENIYQHIRMQLLKPNYPKKLILQHYETTKL